MTHTPLIWKHTPVQQFKMRVNAIQYTLSANLTQQNQLVPLSNRKIDYKPSPLTNENASTDEQTDRQTPKLLCRCELDRSKISLWMRQMGIALQKKWELDGAELQCSTILDMKRHILGEDANSPSPPRIHSQYAS